MHLLRKVKEAYRCVRMRALRVRCGDQVGVGCGVGAGPQRAARVSRASSAAP